jgi:DNA-directed RNA polymerase subunit RPC12/RpoP
MAETRCPNCGRKLDSRVSAGKNIRCPKCGENLRYVTRNEPSQGWEKLANLLEGGGLSPLGSSPAALLMTPAKPAGDVPSPPEDHGKAVAATEPVSGSEGAVVDDSREEDPETSVLLEVRAIGEEFKGMKEDLARIETRLAALEVLLKKR